MAQFLFVLHTWLGSMYLMCKPVKRLDKSVKAGGTPAHEMSAEKCTTMTGATASLLVFFQHV